MQLKPQYFGTVRPKVQPSKGLSNTAKAVIFVGATAALVAFDASASPNNVDMLGGGLTTLPADTLKVYAGLLKIVPVAIGAAAGMAAMRGGMGYVMGLVASALRA